MNKRQKKKFEDKCFRKKRLPSKMRHFVAELTYAVRKMNYKDICNSMDLFDHLFIIRGKKSYSNKVVIGIGDIIESTDED